MYKVLIEKHPVDKARENRKTSHTLVRSKLSVEEQIIWLRDSEGKAEDEKICNELKFKCFPSGRH